MRRIIANLSAPILYFLALLSLAIWSDALGKASVLQGFFLTNAMALGAAIIILPMAMIMVILIKNLRENKAP